MIEEKYGDKGEGHWKDYISDVKNKLFYWKYFRRVGFDFKQGYRIDKEGYEIAQGGPSHKNAYFFVAGWEDSQTNT